MKKLMNNLRLQSNSLFESNIPGIKMHAITRIETVDEGGYIHLQLEKPAGVKVRIIIEDLDTHPNQATTPAESLALARMQEQTGFAKHVLGAAEEDAWNDL
jgi:hypothetical protein